MKVKRMKNGYVIRCSDGDFAMLDALVSATPDDAASRMLTGGAKASHTRRTKAVGANLLHVDVDHRA